VRRGILSIGLAGLPAAPTRAAAMSEGPSSRARVPVAARCRGLETAHGAEMRYVIVSIERLPSDTGGPCQGRGKFVRSGNVKIQLRDPPRVDSTSSGHDPS
jgi:hypothetical protein